MSRYEDLRAAFIKQEEDEFEYWHDLQRRAVLFAKDLTEFLEYPKPDYEDLDGGKNHRYVYITKPGSKDEIRNFTELEGSRGAVDFDIVITLERDRGTYPKSLFRIAMHIGSANGLLRVWSDVANVKADIVKDQPSSYEALYQQIFEALKLQLAARSLLT
ncbi:hypothetical protein HX857_09610 [Pseudomonas gingeri]|uniref:hypothetical protein n=1 Tax=Pseudomonas gingeri TaxID=117681 RepID=UPI0015BF3731|nr:hypothetical protein [Pseudomonas gingeri]NWE68962.1 hypothetical protein [Pseudomonas gingeri]